MFVVVAYKTANINGLYKTKMKNETNADETKRLLITTTEEERKQIKEVLETARLKKIKENKGK